MGGGIFLMRDDGELVGMDECGYDSEALLQGYLARHHDLLAGDQINGDSPRRWLLIKPEMRLERWSVDHLFLDQDAVPPIIETKLSTNTEIRRQVVGQMLEYAANAGFYWDSGKLRETFESKPESAQIFLDFLENPDSDSDDFWRDVERNLQAGKVRLVFVSNSIPDELRRIVEFLNEQMSPAEVIAVEIKQYISGCSNLRTFVPRVIGQTTKAKDHKSAVSRRSGAWDEETFFEELADKVPGAVAPTRSLLKWMNRNLGEITWGRGAKVASFVAYLEHKEPGKKLFEVWTDDRLFIHLGDQNPSFPLQNSSKRSELILRLNSIPGVTISEKTKNKWSSVPLSVVANEDALEQLVEVLDWFVQEVRAGCRGVGSRVTIL